MNTDKKIGWVIIMIITILAIVKLCSGCCPKQSYVLPYEYQAAYRQEKAERNRYFTNYLYQ